MGTLIFWSAIAFLFLMWLSGFKVVRPIEKGIIERFGKYNRTVTQGLTWIVPMVDRLIRINIAETQIDLTKQSVITKDNLNLDIDGVVYYKVHDPLKALYNVNHYGWAIASLAQTTLRSIVGEMNFVEVNAKRQHINARIEQELDQQTESWGIDILRVELQDIQASREVQVAMDKVVTAEREKEALITQAVAQKEASRQVAEATVIEAEADKRAQIERATGEAEAVKINALGEAEAITNVNTAVERTFKDNARKYKTLEVTEASLRHNTKVVLTESGLNPNLIFNDSGNTVVPVAPKSPLTSKSIT